MSPQFASTLPRNFNSSSCSISSNNNYNLNNNNNNSTRAIENFKLKLNRRLETLSQQAPNVETMSVSSRGVSGFSGSLDRRSKYNTLTPAEAKKLNLTLINGRQFPARTASVLHKPRAPKLQVDEFGHQHQQQTNPSTSTNNLRATSPVSLNTCGLPELPDPQEIYGSTYGTIRPLSMGNGNRCLRSNSTCDSRMRRNSSLRYATVKANRAPPVPMHGNDVPDRAFTQSVDLGQPPSYDIYGSTQENLDLERSQLSNESFMSAASHLTESTSDNSKIKSASKVSLSSSTSKVFQSQISSLKRFFRNIPLRKTFSNSTTNTNSQDSHSVDIASEQQILGESISQLYLNRSQSPAACPPPPGELKSMTYMESYSNYDDFTRARNEKNNALLSSNRNNRMNSPNIDAQQQQQQRQQPVSPNDESSSDAWQLTSLPVSYERNLATVFEERPKLEYEPKYPEIYQQRPSQDLLKISTIQSPRSPNAVKPPDSFEDNGSKQSATNSSSQSLSSSNATNDSVLDHYHRPPKQQPPATPYRFSFAQPDPNLTSQNVSLRVTDPSSLIHRVRNHHENAREPSLCRRRRTQEINHLDLSHKIYAFTSTISSSVSTNLDLLHESIDSSNVSQTSSDQPTGLPPRMPLSMNTTTTSGYDSKQQDTSSGASSSNSSVMSGQNDRESPQSLDKVTTSSEYGAITGITDNDADTTIMSDTSTLQGDYNTLAYMNKCSELERTVESLKERVVFKEKEITEFRLEQINSDYLIDQLKKTISRLEKENAQLKSLVINTNRVNL